MNTRTQLSPPTVIPVRLFGIDSDGRPFVQLATARNLTPEQAVLDRVEHSLAPGTLIGIQYQQSKGRAKVLWTCEIYGTLSVQLGIQLIDPGECPWTLALGTAEQAKSPKAERRRFHRHRVAVGMELCDPVSGQRMQARSSDFSLGGCYIETMLPLPVDTTLEVGMWVDLNKISVGALVRTCDPGVGMGIEFTGLTPEKERQLCDLLASCSGQSVSTPNITFVYKT